MLVQEHLTGFRNDQDGLGVSMTIRIDLGESALAAGPWIVLRRRAVRIYSHDLARMRFQALGIFSVSVAVANRYQKCSVLQRGHPAAKMVHAALPGFGGENHLMLRQRVVLKSRSHDTSGVLASDTVPVRQANDLVGL